VKTKLILRLIEWLYKFTYEPITLDKLNSKMIKPVPGLVIDGVQYWQFLNLGDMPRNRMVHYTYMREEMTMGIDRDSQNKIIDKIIAANNAGDRDAITLATYAWKDIINNITTIQALYNVASVMYFDPKEDVGTYDADYNDAKIRKFKTIKDKSFFFSHLLQSSLKITSEQMPSDIQRFLNENEAKFKFWISMVSEPTESKN
jgi:hypothetical protein